MPVVIHDFEVVPSAQPPPGGTSADRSTPQPQSTSPEEMPPAQLARLERALSIRHLRLRAD